VRDGGLSRGQSYVIFTLREEATVSDGTPVTAQDVLFSYEILRDEGLPSFRANLPNTDRRRRGSGRPPHPLRFQPRKPGARAHHDGGGPAGLQRGQPYRQRAGFRGKPAGAAVGSGPYIVGEIDPGRSTVFVRNPDYWGNDLPINRGRHNFESIRIEYYADAIAAFEGFTAGNYLFRQENSSQNWANNYDFPRLSDGTVIREEIPQGTIASGQSFVFNLRREKFQDPRVREAIALMFNFEWTNQTLFYGLYSPIDSFWENTHLEAEGLAPPEELAVLEPFRDRLPEEVFTDPPSPRLRPTPTEPSTGARHGAPRRFWKRPAGRPAMTGCCATKRARRWRWSS
jgi:microcin C transport system substrate-binding protein